MYYNFYVYLIVLAILSPVVAFNKEKILKNMSITNDIFYTSLVIVVIVGIKKILSEEKFIPNLTIDTGKRFSLQCGLVMLVLFMGGTIIIKENVLVYKSLQKSVYLIILLIYSVCFMKMDINMQMILGILLIMGGAYLIDNNATNIKI